MLAAVIIVYLIFTLFLGVWASRKVHNSTDFLLAGKSLPLHLATFTVFATWFGAETVMGASSTFVQGGMRSVIEDPFGAALGLLVVGLVLARPMYRMDLLTICDYWRIKYGTTIERLIAVMMLFTFFGWIAAQMAAMGTVLHTIMGIDTEVALVVASLLVIIYTFWGGMWAVSLTDFIQTIIIVVGIIATLIAVLPLVGGLQKVLMTQPSSFYNPLPKATLEDSLHWFAALLSLGFGSIPGQDIYQRVMSSKSEEVAVRSTILAAMLYLSIGLLPLLLGLVAHQLYPNYTDKQALIPHLVLQHTNFWVQSLFFGALVSAIMSTASGSILAPAAILGENILRPILGENLTERQFLWLNRFSVVVCSGIGLWLALGGDSIYELAGQANIVGLVSLFIPLVASLYFNIRSPFAIGLSVIMGFLTWLLANNIAISILPPTLFAMMCCGFSLLIGEWVGRKWSL